MEIISFLIHVYSYLLIYEALTEERKSTVKWYFLALFGVTKYILELSAYTSYLWPLVMFTLLILYSMCIRSKHSNLENFKYAILTYGIDFIYGIVMACIFGMIAGILDIGKIDWSYFFACVSRIIFIIAVYKFKICFEKIKQSWVFYIATITTTILVFAEQVIRSGYVTDNNFFVYMGLACTYIAALFTILWFLDHFKMIKIQKEYEADNRQMSQKLHRSKEILPLLADYISGMEEIPDEKLREKLQEVCRDYGKELGAIEMSPALFHTTGIELVDLLIQNKVEECRRRGIEMDVFVGTTIEEDMERLDISDGELVRMLADLLRNAINAVKDMEEAVILTVVARDEHGHVEIDIHDSGKPFPPEILEKFGERGNTTWGTGNGIADLMESLRRVNASIEIIPEEEPDDVFTKQICIRFDGEGEVKVKKDQVSA